jgi:hypothetical protein
MPLPTIPDGLHTSISQMKCFLRCPRQYELKYKLGIQPAFMPVAFAFGLSFHGAAAALYSELKATGKLPPREMLVDTFRDAWGRSSEGPLPLQDDEDEPVDTGAVTDKGIEMIEVFHAHVAKTMNGHTVEGVEVPFVAALHDPDTGGVLDEHLVGTMDLVLRIQVVTKAKVPVMQVADVERGPRDEDDFLRTAVGVLRAVDAGVAYPVRGWACRSCQFARACKPKRPKLALVAWWSWGRPRWPLPL